MIARLLISPSLQSRVEEINKSLMLHIGGVTLTHPDILYFKTGEKLGIEQARKIKEHFSLKPYSAKGRAVVMEEAGSLTIEAQNALLKILEEPPKEALILLGTKSEADLLPTILSRCQIVTLQRADPVGRTHGTYGVYDRVYDKDIDVLLNVSIDERFEYIEKLKDKEEFLKALVQYFHQNLSSHSSSGNSNHQFLKELLQAERWAAQNVNIRAILEYLMLVMPQI